MTKRQGEQAEKPELNTGKTLSLEELTAQLKKLFPYNDEIKILKTPDIPLGYKAAYEHLKDAQRAQENCTSDSSYWAIGSDIAFAKVLCAIFLHLQRGNSTFPPLKTDALFLMDYQADLEEWAQQLVSDHQHVWESISLKHGDKNENYPEGIEYGGIVYNRCKICKVKQWDWTPPEPKGWKR